MNHQPDKFAQTSLQLQEARQKRGLSIHDVAHKLGIASTRIQYFESMQFDSLDVISRKQLQDYFRLLDIRSELPVNKKITRSVSLTLDEPMRPPSKLTWKNIRKPLAAIFLFIFTCLYTYHDVIKRSVNEKNGPTTTVVATKINP